MSQAEARYPILVAPSPGLIGVQDTGERKGLADRSGADHLGATGSVQAPTLGSMTSARPEPTAEPHPFGPGPMATTYRFRCGGRHRHHRRIEIEGQQTLGHLDVALRQAFRLPLTDGTSSFELVNSPEGQVRVAALDLGVVDPYEGEGSAERTIADLRLEPGACLRYRCELLDRVEHEIALEAVEIPNPKVCYPRIVDGDPAR